MKIEIKVNYGPPGEENELLAETSYFDIAEQWLGTFERKVISDTEEAVKRMATSND